MIVERRNYALPGADGAGFAYIAKGVTRVRAGFSHLFDSYVLINPFQ